jgi:hypothetical protein
MPTTPQEAIAIVRICREEGIDLFSLANVTRRLHVEVGQHSTNQSVKDTMLMLYESTVKLLPGHPGLEQLSKMQNSTPDYEPQTYDDILKSKMWFIYLLIIVGLHALVWVGLVISCFVLPFLAPVYVALPCIAFCVTQALTRERCPMTHWENSVRKRLSMPKIGHFGAYYFNLVFKKGKS